MFSHLPHIYDFFLLSWEKPLTANGASVIIIIKMGACEKS